MEKYHGILQRSPSLELPSQDLFFTPGKARGVGQGRGHPPTSPRLLLDAILWKLATGHSRDEVPRGFPSACHCSKYYRRLYRSGRWYTLMLALYNHFRMESSADLVTLLENGVFTTTPSQRIAIDPQVYPNWENCTALLFMQLACSARSHMQKVFRQDHPLYRLYPDLKGTAPLTTGLPPGIPLPTPSGKPSSKHFTKPVKGPSSQPSSSFQPIEESLAWKKWLKIEQDRQTIIAELSRRLHPPDQDNTTRISSN
jgi:hypothetical protein